MRVKINNENFDMYKVGDYVQYDSGDVKFRGIIDHFVRSSDYEAFKNRVEDIDNHVNFHRAIVKVDKILKGSVSKEEEAIMYYSLLKKMDKEEAEKIERSLKFKLSKFKFEHPITSSFVGLVAFYSLLNAISGFALMLPPVALIGVLAFAFGVDTFLIKEDKAEYDALSHSN